MHPSLPAQPPHSCLSPSFSSLPSLFPPLSFIPSFLMSSPNSLLTLPFLFFPAFPFATPEIHEHPQAGLKTPNSRGFRRKCLAPYLPRKITTLNQETPELSHSEPGSSHFLLNNHMMTPINSPSKAISPEGTKAPTSYFSHPL